MKKIFITLFSVLFLNQQVLAVNLFEALSEAYKNNTDLNAERENINISESNLKISKGNYLPIITISGSKSREDTKKLTNRTGTVSIGDQEKVGKYTKCFYPSYQFLIDWNGDIFLCPQDWQRRVTMGNMMQEHTFDIWNGKIMNKYRQNLINGKRDDNPCKMCNAEGTILGKKHANAWNNIYLTK